MFLSKHRLNIASLRIGKHCIVKNIASLRKVNIAHPYQRVALPEKINESSWILKQKVSQITYLTYEAGLVSISLKSSLVFDELKLSWRHDGSKNSTPNPALISARPSVKWQLFSYKEENQSKNLNFKNQPSGGKLLPHYEVNHRPGRLDKPNGPRRREMASRGWKRKDRQHFQRKVCPKIQL